MGDSCEPGIGQLTRWLTRDLDFSRLPMTSATETKSAANDEVTVFSNGPIITMANGSFSPVDALVVKAGVIIYAGTIAGAHEVAGAGAVNVNLNGQCLLPGFIEPHIHVIITALAENYLLNLSPMKVTTLDEATNIIKEAISKKNLLGNWVAGYGYDPSRVDGHPDLKKGLLDNIAPNNPVFIMNQSGHVAYVNSVALELAGVTAANAGSNYQQSGGQLTGVIFEQAVTTIGQLAPQPDPAQLVSDCRKTLSSWVAKGCTTVFDAGIGTGGPSDVPLLNAVTSLNEPPIRLFGALSVHIMPTDANIVSLIQPPIKVGNTQIQAIKIWADGSTQGFTAALNQPYLSPPPGMPIFGTLNYADENKLYNEMVTWMRAGFQIVVHANGDRAVQQTLNVYEALLKDYAKVPHPGMHRIEHVTVVEREQLARAQSLGLGVSHTIGHVHYWGETFQQYVLGDDRAVQIDPIKSDDEVGLVFSFHSDSPVTDVDPLLYLRTATTRLTYQHHLELGKSERVELETALRGITINPAKQIGIADKVGTLEKNKLADMVVLNKDPRTVDIAQLHELVVEQVWIGGKRCVPNQS